MRVLRLHTTYTREGGEDHSFHAEVALLEQHGIEVRTLLRSNASVVDRGILPTMGALWRTPYDRELYRDVRQLCRRFRPDVAHADNLWFALSPSVHAACHDEGVPTVQSLRNYRLLCLNGLLFRGGRPCEACVGRSPWPGIRHRCYHGSAFLSSALARMLQVNRRRGTWTHDVDLFVTPSRFARRKFVEAGFAPETIVVKPNFLPDPGPSTSQGEGGVYVGRLSVEKGVGTLIDAWLDAGKGSLRVVGDGPDRATLEDRARGRGHIRFLGHRGEAEVQAQIRRSAFLVFPSPCYETFGRTVMEAFALGRPVIASLGGAAADLVEEGQNGLLFRPGDREDLARKIARLVQRPDVVAVLGRGARRTYEARFTAEQNLERLVSVYAQARRVFADRHRPTCTVYQTSRAIESGAKHVRGARTT